MSDHAFTLVTTSGAGVVIDLDTVCHVRETPSGVVSVGVNGEFVVTKEVGQELLQRLAEVRHERKLSHV